MKRFAFAFALTLIMLATAAAQGTAEQSDALDRRPTIHYTSAVEGVEASPGFVAEKSDVRTATTYAMDVSGTLAGHFTVVFDSTGPDPDPINGNQIVSGRWTMAVYRDGVYQGTLFGEITSGTMSWKGDGQMMTFGNIRAEFIIKGGTKGLARIIRDQGYGSFDLFWESDPKGDTGAPPTLSGKLELAF